MAALNFARVSAETSCPIRAADMAALNSGVARSTAIAESRARVSGRTTRPTCWRRVLSRNSGVWLSAYVLSSWQFAHRYWTFVSSSGPPIHFGIT
jgi:hypothetical protein